MTTLAKSGFDCQGCGQHHDELPLVFAFAAPDFANGISVYEKEERIQASEDWCIVDNKYFYLRGCLDFPVKGTAETFSLGTWVAVSEDDFDRVMELWEQPGRENEPAYTGRLANAVTFYPECRSMEVTVRTRPVGERPLFQLPASNHPLCVDHAQGMERELVEKLAALTLHGSLGAPASPWNPVL